MEIRVLNEAINLFQAKVESQGMVVNERDAEHLKHLIELRAKAYGYKRYARQCSVTQKGMNEGWVWGDGIFYTSTLKQTLKECRKDREHILFDVDKDSDICDYDRYDKFIEALNKAKNNAETDEDLLLIAFQTDYMYYTEWECTEDYQYEEINGILTEIK